jgi:hypothetical protein
MSRLEPLRHIRTGVLEIAYFEAGPSDGDPVPLLHGFPYDIRRHRLGVAGARRGQPATTRSPRRSVG